ncbi:DUF6660 family protein [Sphingobacterium sp. LRF_L2]|uniref:DUF6660 family protein n=1 Tax=Sphingobacterium sp. LRF_L2 TaxID=3369421 RepID=UPI003F5F3384
MRFFIGILAIYVLLLSGISCKDSVSYTPDSVVTAIGDTQDGTHDHTEHSGDGCSPFCSCNCCSVNMVSINFFEIELGKTVAIDLPKLKFFQRTQHVSHYPSRIWQPPKFNA